MKDRKRRLEIFSLYNRSGLEKHLTEMAEKGWLLEKIGSFLWTYRKIEPKKLAICVCWFPKASAFDPEPSEEQQTFYDFCEHTGWVLAASSGQMQVFYNETAHPVPIETDPVMEVDAIYRAAKRTALPAQTVLLFLSLLNGGLFLSRLLADPVGVLSSAANLFTGMCWAVLFLMTAVECAAVLLWHRRAVKAARRGEFLEAKSHRTFQIICLSVTGLGLAYYAASVIASGSRMTMTITLLMFCVYLPGLFLAVNGMKTLLKRKKVSARVNRIVTVVSAFAVGFLLIGGITWTVLSGSARGAFAGNVETYEYRGAVFAAPQDELPVTVEDLLGVSYDGYIRGQSNQQTLLLAQYSARQYPRFDAAAYREMPCLEYSVTHVKVPLLYNLCKNALLANWERDWKPEGEKDYAVPTGPVPWGAEDAFQLANQAYGLENTFLLCYEDRIVEITFSPGWEVTTEQMALIAEKIGTNSR